MAAQRIRDSSFCDITNAPSLCVVELAAMEIPAVIGYVLYSGKLLRKIQIWDNLFIMRFQPGWSLHYQNSFSLLLFSIVDNVGHLRNSVCGGLQNVFLTGVSIALWARGPVMLRYHVAVKQTEVMFLHFQTQGGILVVDLQHIIHGSGS